MDSFGSRLKKARTDKKITQRELATLIDVSYTSISEWENGHHKPDIDTLEVMCQVLNVQPSWLLCSDETPVSNNNVISSHLMNDIENLPEQARQELDTFIDWLKAKYKKD